MIRAVRQAMGGLLVPAGHLKEGFVLKTACLLARLNRDPVQHKQELHPLKRRAVCSRIPILGKDRVDDEFIAHNRST